MGVPVAPVTRAHAGRCQILVGCGNRRYRLGNGDKTSTCRCAVIGHRFARGQCKKDNGPRKNRLRSGHSALIPLCYVAQESCITDGAPQACVDNCLTKHGIAAAAGRRLTRQTQTAGPDCYPTTSETLRSGVEVSQARCVDGFTRSAMPKPSHPYHPRRHSWTYAQS